jgi:hypothetical protein
MAHPPGKRRGGPKAASLPTDALRAGARRAGDHAPRAGRDRRPRRRHPCRSPRSWRDRRATHEGSSSFVWVRRSVRVLKNAKSGEPEGLPDLARAAYWPASPAVKNAVGENNSQRATFFLWRRNAEGFEAMRIWLNHAVRRRRLGREMPSQCVPVWSRSKAAHQPSSLTGIRERATLGAAFPVAFLTGSAEVYR